MLSSTTTDVIKRFNGKPSSLSKKQSVISFLFSNNAKVLEFSRLKYLTNENLENRVQEISCIPTVFKNDFFFFALFYLFFLHF